MAAQKSEAVVTIGGAVVPPSDALQIRFDTPPEGPPTVVLLRDGEPVKGPWRVSLFAEQGPEK